jgi:hypothetical protein
MMAAEFLFEVPTEFMAAFQSNEISRFGGVLKDNASGKIVGHLQDAGISNSILNGLSSGPLAPVNTISSLAANAQLAGIKNMLEILQVFQFATLGVSVAGLGVSAIGFTVMNKRMKSISTAIDHLTEQMNQRFDEAAASRIRDSLSNLKGIIAIAKHKFETGESDSEWDRLGKQFIGESERFRAELEYMLSLDTVEDRAFDAILSAYFLSSSSAAKSLLLADKLDAARICASSVSRSYDEFFDDLTPIKLSSKLSQNLAAANQAAFEEEVIEAASQKVRFIREVQEVASTLPNLIDTLERRKLSGSEYLRSLQTDKRSPLLVLRG